MTMKTRILKIITTAATALTLVFLVGCAQNMDSGKMDTSMNSMEEKPMTEMQEEEKMNSMGAMDEMKKEDSMEKSSVKEKDSMDKMMK
jgi:Flp pilus assembly protein TadD